MKNKISYILCFLTLSLFILIFVQERTGVFQLKKLNGVYYEPKKPALSLENILNNSYQDGIEKDLRFHFGFREIIIRLYNQYMWDFYHRSTNYTITVGKGNWLYGLNEVLNYYQSAMYNYTSDKEQMKRQLDLEAQRMYKVQNILGEYGVFIFVSLLPSKAFLFPEYLPDNPESEKEPYHAIAHFRQAFDSLGVNYIDVQKIFESQKGHVDYPLFPLTGMHWSYIAAEHSFDTILRYVEDKGKMNLHNFTIGEKYTAQPKHPDTDLEDIMNLLRPIKPNTHYYADVQTIDDSTATYPRFILIGDSYFWNIEGSIPLNTIFSSYQYWYYNSTIYFDNAQNHTSKVDILKEILKADIINLSYSPRQLYVFSNKFLPKALLYLTHDDDEIDSTLNVIAATLNDTPEEERMNKAKDMLFSEPEKYFEDLSKDGIPTTRNRRIQLIKNG